MSRDLNWTDLLNEDPAYVVLRKGNRLQVLWDPSAKQLRRRGKRNWCLVAAVQKEPGTNGEDGAPRELCDAVLGALGDLASALHEEPKRKKKAKKKEKVKQARDQAS